MIVMMDMSSGSRLNDEESLSFARECLITRPLEQPTPQIGAYSGIPQVGLQLAMPEPAQHPVLRMPPHLAAMSLIPISDEVWRQQVRHQH